jgi:fumarate reductase flavoprotein subunit
LANERYFALGGGIGLMRKVVFMGIALSAVFLLSLAYAASKNEVTGKHKENDLECADCHGVPEPSEAADIKACMDCHGDMIDADPVIFIDKKGKQLEHYPHDSHEAPIKCTECHAAHKPTRLYCNKCHEFTNTVP